MLTAKLKEKIKSLPTNTIIGSKDNQITQQYNIYKKIVEKTSFSLPSTFDGVKIWGDKLSDVFEQGNCGSCWAFASNSVLADRFNIQSMGLILINLSPTKMLLCSDVNLSNPISSEIKEIDNISNFACFGNTLNKACDYLYIYGSNTIKCIGYDSFGDVNKFQDISKFKEFSKLPLCSKIAGPDLDMCDDKILLDSRKEVIGKPARFYRSFQVYGIYGTTLYDKKGSEEQIRIDIYKWGPVCTAFEVYPNFYTFDPNNEIYEWDGKGDKISGHAVEIVGWGEENGKKYWQIKNSWGKNWGQNGYFKMIRGTNNCKIEDNCLGMLPDFFYANNYDKKQHIDIDIVDNINKNKIDKERNLFINNVSDGGGIVPTTGYSRRAMNEYPWLDLKRPISLNNLPNWENFIAGNDSTKQNSINFVKSINNINSGIRYDKQTSYIFIFPVIIIMLAVLILLFFLLFKKK